ncbi:MAG TPA: amino acid--tRNA ligase-related protein, partial [Legionellaceae bacterium]|nr:amino acid--tRNA ligase-related protein [Legionellaceae bacterium]
GVDILGDEKYLRKKLELYNIEAGDESSYATLVAKFINFFVLREIERPLVINGLPHGLTPLMKPHPDDNRFADRYWLFINKTDFCDIGSEQANYEDQKRALYQQYKELNTKKAHANVNNDILNILAFGIPPIAGIGMSLSRIMMLLGNVQDIREAGVFYFQ